MANRTLDDIISGKSKLAPVIQAAVKAGAVSATDPASNGLLVAVECVIELRAEAEGGAIPTYKRIANKISDHPMNESGSLSKTTIKKAIDIVYQRAPTSTQSGKTVVNLLEYIVEQQVVPVLIKGIMTEPVSRNYLTEVRSKVESILVPIAVSISGDFEIGDTRLVIAEGITYKLQEPESSFSDLRRYLARKFETVMSLVSYNKINEFVVSCAAENIFTEYDVNRTSEIILNAGQQYMKISNRISEDRAIKMLNIYIAGVIEELGESRKYKA